MGKLSVPKILETSRLLGTKSGKELEELVSYVSVVSTQLIQLLRNGLNYDDNFDCYKTQVSLTHNINQIVNKNSTRTPTEVRAQRVISTSVPVPSLTWFMDAAGELNVKPFFAGSPPTSSTQQVDIIIYF